MKRTIIQMLWFMLFLFGIFGIKFFLIGIEPPNEESSKTMKFLNYALIPTDIPKEVQELDNTRTALENSQRNQQYLREELSSRGDILDRENKRRETIIKVINNNFAGVLKGKGQTVYEASTANKYPPYLQASIIIHETGNGISKAVRSLNNVGGIFAGDSLKSYKTLDDGIWDMATRIKRYYIDEGKTTIEAFGKKYCPVGAGNDPTNLNKYWIPTVNKYYIKMINESQGLV